MSEGESATEGRTGGRRRILWWTLGVAALLVIVALAVGALISDEGEGLAAGPSPSPGSSASADPGASPGVPTPDGPGSGADPAPIDQAPIDPDFGAPVAMTVPRSEAAELVGGPTARLEIGEVAIEATGAGEVSGPAARVVLQLSNDGSSAVSVDGISVNAYRGAERAPVSPLLSPADAASPSGQLAPGQSATGTYYFSIGAGEASELVVTVATGAAPLTVFVP